MQIDRDRAREMVADWYRRRVPGSGYGQTRGVADILVNLCITEADRANDDEDAFFDRLTVAGDLLHGLQFPLAPEKARRAWYAGEVSGEDRKEVDQAKDIVWRRHDPSVVYQLGPRRTNYPGVEKGELAGAAASYLSRPWMRHPILDWIIVDALVTGEIVAYGESLKERYMVGPTDTWERSQFFQKHGGDVAVLEKQGRRYRPHPVRNLILFNFALPAVAIAVSLYADYVKTAFAIAALTVLDWVVISVRLSVFGLRWVLASPEARAGPKAREYKLFSDMRDTWFLLGGPVVNPTLLRAQMEKARGGGAVFDSVAWAVVDRVIAHDPSVWIVSSAVA